MTGQQSSRQSWHPPTMDKKKKLVGGWALSCSCWNGAVLWFSGLEGQENLDEGVEQKITKVAAKFALVPKAVLLRSLESWPTGNWALFCSLVKVCICMRMRSAFHFFCLQDECSWLRKNSKQRFGQPRSVEYKTNVIYHCAILFGNFKSPNSKALDDKQKAECSTVCFCVSMLLQLLLFAMSRAQRPVLNLASLRTIKWTLNEIDKKT